MGADADAILAEYDGAAKALVEELKKEMRGAGYPGMFGPEYLGRLFHLQKVANEKAGEQAAAAFAERFAADEADMKRRLRIP